MKFGLLHHDEDAEPFNTASMVDVVFILLAFFVLTTRFVGTENDIAMAPAEVVGSQSAAQEDLPTYVAVRVWDDGDAGVGLQVGQVRVGHNEYEQITARLNTVNLPETPVVVIADRDLAMQSVAAAIDAVLRSSMKQMSLVGADYTGLKTASE